MAKRIRRSPKKFDQRKEVKRLSERKQDKDAFDSYQEVCDNAIEEIAKLQAQYVQSFTNLQQEASDTYRKVTTSTIAVTKEFANATWGSSRIPVAPVKAASDSTDAFLKAAAVNNKALIATLDATRQNIRIFNDNIDTFTKLNLNLIKTWQSFVPFRA